MYPLTNPLSLPTFLLPDHHISQERACYICTQMTNDHTLIHKICFCNLKWGTIYHLYHYLFCALKDFTYYTYICIIHQHQMSAGLLVVWVIVYKIQYKGIQSGSIAIKIISIHRQHYIATNSLDRHFIDNFTHLFHTNFYTN